MKTKQTATAKKPATKEHAGAGDAGRRDRRSPRKSAWTAARRTIAVSTRFPSPSTAGLGERRAKVNRRRQIDPTTCERDYTPEEIEFMGAMDNYKRRSGRMFPTCSEVLEVIRSLGYVKQIHTEPVVLPTSNVSAVAIETPLLSARSASHRTFMGRSRLPAGLACVLSRESRRQTGPRLARIAAAAVGHR